MGVTAGYALYQGWPLVLPVWATIGDLATPLVIGALAGLYPAVRASRLSPTEALATPWRRSPPSWPDRRPRGGFVSRDRA
ncbi:hypothetical protein ABT352_03365 [Streptosporangium sp. NPDC000563]|uniref:ABC transporter permease n=1 Tax=Streptosporangium sp. NPDC000563 TaxID=3154366 RepID=UPI0033181439